jgi:long-chain acyl-CoA synthetase
VPDGSLAELLALRLTDDPDFPLIYVEDEGPWTVGRIALAARTYADALRSDGIGPGKRVIVRVGNDERFLVALVGTWLVGGAAVAVHPGVPDDEAIRIGSMLDAATPEAPDRVPLTGPSVSTLDVPRDVAGTDEALVLMTSGSTGDPKGVVLTHGAGWANLRATVAAFRSDTAPAAHGDRDAPPNLVANPFSHTGGVVRLLFALYVGRRLVVLRKFDAAKTKALIDRHGINQLTLNPTMLRMLLDLPDGVDLGPVRYVSSGTAPLSPSLREKFETRFAVPVLQAYGQTEAFGGIAVESVKDVLSGRRRPNSVGRPLPGVEVEVVDASGSPVPTGVDGQIRVRSASSMAGYAGSATAAPVDQHGWLHTGDAGHVDADGYLYVTGRLKSTIICGGFNIVPEELEATLERDDAVRSAVVVPIPDERLGEIPVALVEASDSADAILERCRGRLVAYKRPRQLFVVDALPLLASGKVDRAAASRVAASQMS